MTRYRRLDEIRGITMLSMLLYHMLWDLVYQFGVQLAWYRSGAAYVWQQSICWVFILLSGFCFPLGRRKWKRGLTVLAVSLLVTAATCLVIPDSRVIFGVLTLLGSSMLLMIPLEHVLCRLPAEAGLCCSLALFALLRNVNEGSLGFERWHLLTVPEGLYRNLFTAYLGFPPPGFFSTDYFSLLPWFFLFAAGYYLHGAAKKRGWMPWLEGRQRANVGRSLGWLGRHSLEIYVVHQPVLMVALSLLL